MMIALHKVFSAMAFTVCFVWSVSYGQQAGSPINWIQGDLNEAFRQAAATGHDVYALVSTKWCSSCTDLKERVLTIPEIASYINQTFVPVEIDGDVATEIVKKYNIPGFPTAIIFDSLAEERGRIVGTSIPVYYFDLLKKIVTEGRTLTQLIAEYKADPSNPVRLEVLINKYSETGMIGECQRAYDEMRSKFAEYFSKHRAKLSHSLATTYFFAHKYEEAAIYFHDITIAGGDEGIVLEAYLMLSNCYHFLERPADLFKTLDNGIIAFPKAVVLYAFMVSFGVYYPDYLDHSMELGKVGLTLEGAIGAKAYLRYWMSRAYHTKGQIDEAIRMIDEAIALDPNPDYIRYRKQLVGEK